MPATAATPTLAATAPVAAADTWYGETWATVNSAMSTANGSGGGA